MNRFMIHDEDGSYLSTETCVEILREDMVVMTDGERIALMNSLMDGYCKHCGTRCMPCSCQEFWMEH